MSGPIMAEPPTFATWLRDRKQFGRTIPLLLYLSGYCASTVWHIWGADPLFASDFASRGFFAVEEAARRHPSAVGWLAGLQAILCLALVVAMPRPAVGRVPETRSRTAVRAVRRVLFHAKAIYLTWAVYYANTALGAFSQASTSTEEAALDFVGGVVLTIMSTITAVLLAWLALELSEVTVFDDPADLSRSTPVESTLAMRKDRARWFRFVTGGVGIVLISLAVHILLRVFAIDWVRSSERQMHMALDVIVSLASGVATAAVAMSFYTKRLNPGLMTLMLLMLYAVIQTAAIAFVNYTSVAVVATTLAMILKTVLWAVLVWAFSSGRMWEYAVEFREKAEAAAQPA